MAQREKLPKPEIRLHNLQRLKMKVIKKELHVSQQAQGSTSSTILTNSIYHINASVVTTRIQKVVEVGEEKEINDVQRAHIESTPFKWVLDISNDFSISGGLLWELVIRWDSQNMGFRVRDMIIPLTPVDVCFAIGLSIVEFYFPKTENKVFTGFIKHLDDLDSLDIYSWDLAVYNFVVASLWGSSVVLIEGQNRSQRHLNECAAVLQIWTFNHLSLGKAPAVSRLTFPRIIERVVATEEEMKYDIFNAALFEQGQQFVDPHDYQRLVAENRDFQERITILEGEVRMLKDSKDNSRFENKDVQDDQQIVNFIAEDEVRIYVGDVGHKTPPNDDANVVENQPKSISKMATRMNKKPRTKRGKNSRMNL
ncbi:uncharacterized protein LOC131622504 [Vicia villosa]|uniref:uncharacterized protein LOC131622504 n=1 Tax=Vicia villosa TaxID=3911 RepID=UPI00273AC2E4|nr:uncharacterized protein LOC131622504 [Vicia villosa]